jgi:putative tricarboxylic transport membrane protein
MFGAADYCALMLPAFIASCAVFGRSITLGLLSLFFGLALGVVGTDPQSSYPRYDFGIVELLDGIDVTVAVVAMLAIGEILWITWAGETAVVDRHALRGSLWMSREDFRAAARYPL